jgi:NADPH:quinone reductase-like Zn-dependent oxidoreductase
MSASQPPDDHERSHRGAPEDRAALVAHAALFDHLAPVCGARVLVHDTAASTGFHAVQLAKAAGALTVAAAVTGVAEARAAQRAGADLVIDTTRTDAVALLRRHTGEQRPIHRIVHGRFGHDPGIDLALLVSGGVIAAHALAGPEVCTGWWPELLAAGITLKLVAFGALPRPVLERARADVRDLRAAGRWHDAG